MALKLRHLRQDVATQQKEISSTTEAKNSRVQTHQGIIVQMKECQSQIEKLKYTRGMLEAELGRLPGEIKRLQERRKETASSLESLHQEAQRTREDLVSMCVSWQINHAHLVVSRSPV